MHKIVCSSVIMDEALRYELFHLQLWEMEEREADAKGMKGYSCPCKLCMGGKCLNRDTIRKHLRSYKRDPEFRRSVVVCISKFKIEFY